MSLITRGFGGFGLIGRGFGRLVEIIERLIEGAIGRIRRIIPLPRKRFLEMEIPVVGTVFIIQRLFASVAGSWLQRLSVGLQATGSVFSGFKTSLQGFGALKVPYESSVRSLSGLQIPTYLSASCIGSLRVKLAESFDVRGKKTFERLKLLFTVLDEEPT